jgi:hypothetical protein
VPPGRALAGLTGSAAPPPPTALFEAVDTLRALLVGQQRGSQLWFTLAEFAGIIVVTFALASAVFQWVASA